MSTNAVETRIPRNVGPRSDTGHADHGPSITIATSIRADRYRIFQVLTVAEYIETWLTLPDQSGDWPLIVTSDPNSFRIDWQCRQKVGLSIAGSFRTFRRSKLLFTWTKQGMNESGNSLVSIRLHGDFERTKLYLTHSGLGSLVERSWHHEMWNRSLHKLSHLF